MAYLNNAYRVNTTRSAGRNKHHKPSKARRTKHHLRRIQFEAELQLISMSLYSSGDIYKSPESYRNTCRIRNTLKQVHAFEFKTAIARKEMSSKFVNPDRVYKDIPEDFSSWLIWMLNERNKAQQYVA